ncbi:MAG: carbohydrate-binding domain-containing protein [Clostridia bacterium]|nr:carbohydrate-binding domain-containing protein [Clostridia bacterium]
MKKLIIFTSILLILAILFVSCKTQSDAEEGESTETATEAVGKTASDESADVNEDNFDSSLEATSDFSITPNDGVRSDGSTLTVTDEGTYTLSGKLEGNVVVDAGDDSDVTLVLSDCTIASGDDAPISVISASDVTVEVKSGTYNAVYDNRQGSVDASSESDDNVDGAIYAVCDLALTGSGSLIVESSYDNGIKTKDDLEIEDVTLKVTSPGNALKGNDSVTIRSGALILTSSESDGIKTKNSDVSSKGNQRGTISIEGGHVDVYAACDGISAAYNVEISDDDDCVVNIYTASYANSESSSTSNELYLILPSDDYDTSYDYFAYFYNDDDSDGVWKQFEYDTMVYSGRTAYYGLSLMSPDGYSNFLVNKIKSGSTPDGTNYAASSGGETLNTSMNAYLVTGISGSSIDGDWVTLSSGNGSSSKTTYSSKGVKAANEIAI